jgi:hypothetical protein
MRELKQESAEQAASLSFAKPPCGVKLAAHPLAEKL